MANNNVVDFLRTSGVLMDVDVGTPSGELDLGLTKIAAGLDNKLFKSREVVFPTDKLKSIRSKGMEAHSVLRKRSFPFPGDQRFVPAGLVGNVSEEIGVIRKDFDALADALEPEYEPLRAAVEAQWINEAKRLRASGKIDDKQHAEIVARIGKNREPWSKFRRKFYIDLRMVPAPVPEGIDEAFKALDEKKELGDELKKLHAEAKTRIANETQSFVASLIPNMRAQAIAVVEHLKTYADEHDGALHGKSIRAARETLEALRKLNFYGDAEFDKQLAAFADTYLQGNSGKEYAEDKKFQAEFKKSATVFVDGLKSTVDEAVTSTFGKLGVGREIV